MKREVSGLVLVMLIAGFALWVAPFFFRGPQSQKPGTVDRRARWGIVLEGIGFFIVFQPYFRTPEAASLWQVVAGGALLLLAALFSWTGRKALGRQWRLDAGLNVDHELVRSGPYRFVRHPIYASMLCLLLGDGFLLTRWRAHLVAFLIFIAGTEIRVRIEDGLLASRFGELFSVYRKLVPAYIPLLR